MPNDSLKPKLRIATAITVTLLLGATCLYVAAQLYSILNHTYKTETAISYTLSDSITLDGVAVFAAQDVPGTGNLGYLVADGERVTGGTLLAEQYTNDDQATLRERLTELNETITLLDKSQNSSGSDLSLLTSQTSAALYDLLDQIDTANYADTKSYEQQFLLAQNRLQVSTGQASNFSAAIATLTQERDTLAAQLGQLNGITADTNGYFVSAANAGFLSVGADTLAAATPAELKTLLDNGLNAPEQNLAGRIVTGFSWTFYAVCSADDAARFAGLTSVKISVPGKQDTPLAATVTAVETDQGSGLAKITLQCQTVNAAVLSLGQVRARIDLHSYDGIRIDRSALHIVEGAKGVYVKYGNLQRFRKITVLYENENYILVPKGGAVGTDNEVRLYDEIIVDGKKLQDGKLL